MQQTWMLHARVVIEKLPTKMWTLEGAEEALGKFCLIDRLDSHTFERRDMKTFAYRVWCWSLIDIPTRHCMSVFSQGAGRVEEMLGFSPPNRTVAQPPSVERHSLLFHIDMVENWTPREPHSPSSRQSILPSSGSKDDDTHPFPEIEPFDWTLDVEDDREVIPLGGTSPPSRAPAAATADAVGHERGRGRHAPRVSSTGCRGMPP